MHSKQIGENIFLIDLETGGYKNLIASYVITGEQNLVVETGPASSVDNLLLGLAELKLRGQDIAYVAVSHVHIDHAGGAGRLLKSLPNAKIIVHPKGAPHLMDPAKLWRASKETLGDVALVFGEPESVPKGRIVEVSDGASFDLGKGLRVSAVETPGHASHNVSYYEDRNRALFPGDSAGAYLPEFQTVFPTTPPPFRPDIALVSLEKMMKLNPSVLCYSHFGMTPNAIQRLGDYQVQIRRWLLLVEEGLKHGESDEQIRERILEGDETVRGAVASLKSNPVHRKTLIENSVRGFIEFVRNPKI